MNEDELDDVQAGGLGINTVTSEMVIVDVLYERHRQDQTHGVQSYPSVRVYASPEHQTHFYGLPTETEARGLCDRATAHGRLTWGHIAVEELCEVISAQSDEHRRAELIQLAAVCVAWVEAIDRRAK